LSPVATLETTDLVAGGGFEAAGVGMRLLPLEHFQEHVSNARQELEGPTRPEKACVEGPRMRAGTVGAAFAETNSEAL